MFNLYEHPCLFSLKQVKSRNTWIMEVGLYGDMVDKQYWNHLWV